MSASILIVDDEEGIRKVLAISLADSGYRVFSAGDVDEALRCVVENEPEIVLTDIKMPGRDGIELLREIKRLRPETEVIMITGHGDVELAIQSLKHQAADFILKPIHDELLEAALRRAEERIWMRRQLRQYTENLEQLVADKSRQLLEAERMATIGETIAGLAHTIKNIAGALGGGVFVLEKGLELDDRTYLRQGWEMLKGNLETIRALSMDLLDFGKLSQLDLQPCDPNRPAQEAYALLSPIAAQRGVALCWTAVTGLPSVRLDSGAMSRCLYNLLSNAVDACLSVEPAHEAPRVSLSLEREAAGGVRYTVSDNGSGMDAETVAQLFHPFFSTKGNRGTGIGLMMSRRIVHHHGGSIEVQSTLGQGSTFIVRLPEHPPLPLVSSQATGSSVIFQTGER